MRPDLNPRSTVAFAEPSQLYQEDSFVSYLGTALGIRIPFIVTCSNFVSS